MKKNKINAGVVGTGYGKYVILEALKQLSYVNEKVIYGRNKLEIKKLRNNKIVDKVYFSLKNFLKNKKISLLCLATIPTKQYQVLKIIKKNQFNYMFLEKPLTNRLKHSEEIYKKFKNLKSKIAIDFIFLGLKPFLDFHKLIKKQKILNVKIKWHFKAYHYKNKILNSWKKKPKYGGGIYLFYIVHMIAYLNFFFGRILRIKSKKELKNNLNEIYAVNLSVIYSKNILINIDFNSNSNLNIHKIEVFTKKKIFKLEKKSFDYVKNFKIIILDNFKTILKKKSYKQKYLSKDSRVVPVKNLLDNLILKKKPTSTISDAFKVSKDLQKIISTKI